MPRYFVKSFEDAKGEGLLSSEWLDENGEFYSYDYEYRAGLFLQEGDEPATLIQTDGGEPEDNTFTRDWAWVPGELNKAYEAGYDAAVTRMRESNGENY